MKKKIKVAILFGGKSAEHEVSVRSAKNVADAIDKSKYDVVLVGIDKSGRWLPEKASQILLGSQKLIKSDQINNKSQIELSGVSEIMSLVQDDTRMGDVNVVFPVLHGPYGEDGSMQGLLKLANIPFVGAGVLGSAVGMDKDVMKRLLREANIPIARFVVAYKGDTIKFEAIKEELGLPFFVKPANLGSSVGVSKVKNEDEFNKALKIAFGYDTKILIEEFIKGREIESSVLGNENPIASVPGEIVVHDEFYSYNAKYIDENGASLEIPAKLSESLTKKIQGLAIRTYKTLCCEGMGRVDFFLKENGDVFVNEINTIPGFTNISMYPKLWEASGISYKELIDRLIQLAIERFEHTSVLKATR